MNHKNYKLLLWLLKENNINSIECFFEICIDNLKLSFVIERIQI